jgi:hypothetical protein
MFLDRFDMLISKIILKNKKYIILITFSNEKYFKSSSLLQFQTCQNVKCQGRNH